MADLIPRVFDSTGRFVRDLGRVGSGPGEFRAAGAATAWKGDTVVFFDVGSARISYFHWSGRFVRSVSVAGGGMAWSIRFLSDGSLVAHGSGNRGVVDVIDAQGRIRRSFGTSGTPGEQDRTVAVDTGGVVVIANIFAHEFEQYDANGSLRGRFTIDADWFQPTTAWPAVAPGGPPPRVFTQRMDMTSPSVLWVYSRVPRADWERGLRRSPTGRGYQVDPVRSSATRIEVVDLAAGSVIVSQTVPLFLFPLGDGYIAGYNETQDGLPELILMRYSLVR